MLACMAGAAFQCLGHGPLRLADTQRARPFCVAQGLGLIPAADPWACHQSSAGGDGVVLPAPVHRAAMEAMRVRRLAGLTSHNVVPALPSLTPPPGGDPG